MQKILFLVLIGVIILFQYALWFGHGGIYDSNQLARSIYQQVQLNDNLQERNDNVLMKLEELKGSAELMEARARRELNLLKANETLIILPTNNNN